MNKMCKNKPSCTEARETESQEIKVNVSELILTPLTCASVINEIIKCLVYQKSQVPYPHSWLKSVVNRKGKSRQAETKPLNITVEQHYRVVSTAYNALESITRNMCTQFRQHGEDIRQVLILFGSTVYTPKEAYTIQVSNLAKGHMEDNHIHTNSKNQYKILRNIVLAQEWMHAMESAIPPTNMYVLLQKHLNTDRSLGESIFLPNKQYSLPARIKNFTISLSYEEHVSHNCCDNLLIFEDLPASDCVATSDNIADENNATGKVESDSVEVSSCNLHWFQANVVLKGFKECFIKNVSATELW